eukprot:1950882-Rhodomonas_salina.1
MALRVPHNTNAQTHKRTNAQTHKHTNARTTPRAPPKSSRRSESEPEPRANASPAPLLDAGSVPAMALVSSVQVREARSNSNTSLVSTESHRQLRPPHATRQCLRQ